jgi:hypothetical protein
VLKTMGHASRQTPTLASRSAPIPSSQTMPRMPPAAPPKPPKSTLAVANEGGAAAAAKKKLPPAPPPKPGAQKLPPAPPPKLPLAPPPKPGAKKPSLLGSVESATTAKAPAAASSYSGSVGSSATAKAPAAASSSSSFASSLPMSSSSTTTRTTLSEFGLDAVSIPGFVEPTRPARLFCVSRAKMDVGGMFVEEVGPSQTFTQRDLYLHARNTFVLDTGGSAIFVWYPSSDLDGQDISLGLTVASRYRRAVPSLSYYVEGKSAELLQTDEGRAKFAGLNRVAHSSRATSNVRKTVRCPALRVALVDDGEEPLLFKQSFCGWSSAMATQSAPKGYASKYAQSLQHEESKTAADIAMDEAVERNPGTQPESSEKHHDSEPSSDEFRKRRTSRLVRGNSQGKILSLSKRGVLSFAER